MSAPQKECAFRPSRISVGFSTPSPARCFFWWHYLSNATCLIQASFV